MKKRVEQLLEGRFTYELPGLLFSREKISVFADGEELIRDELYLGTESDERISGYVTSSDRRVVPGLDQFAGTTVQMPFGVDLKGMTPGEVLKGWLCFTTSVGEYKLPFEIGIRPLEAHSSADRIRTLEAFGALAERDFREAYRLFKDKSFPMLLSGASGKIRSLYAGLSKQPVTYQHLEEFLIAAGIKDKVMLSLDQKEKEIYGVRESLSDEIRITRSGWGHLRLDVITEGDFLEPEKHVITDDDFIGTGYHLTYVVRKDRLGVGSQFGKLIIRSPYQELVCRVTASRDTNPGADVQSSEKKQRLSLWKDFRDYRSGRVNQSAWAVSSHYALNRLKEDGFDYPEYRLYDAFVLHEEGRDAEARNVLTSFQDKSFTREDLELAGVYLYLCTVTGLYSDREAAVRRLHNFYNQKGNSFPLFYTLLQLDPAIKESPSQALFMMEELFERGCMNPVLYAEAYNRLSGNVNLLRRLSRFWEQVFLFAGKNGLLTEELSMRFAYLSGYEKSFRYSMYKALSEVCRAYPAKDSLEAICRYIMLGNPRRKEYFPWYQKAVEQGIRITRIYEYYVETMDTSYRQELPKSLLMYFHYNSDSLGDARKAYLYACVISAKEKDPETYESYRDNIRAFARAKLLEGRMNEDYACIYQEFLGKPENEEEAEALCRLLFVNRLYFDDTRIHTVVVRHHQLSGEETYPVIQGIAYPRIYTEDAVILFQDDQQRRYGATVDYSCKKMLDENRFLSEIMPFGIHDAGILLHICEDTEIDRETLPLFEQLTASEDFSEAYRQQVRRKILDHYRTNVHGDSLDRRLKKIDYRNYALPDRQLLLSILIDRGLYTEALKIVEDIGVEGLDKSALLRLTSRSLVRCEMEENDELLALASAVYRSGLHDEVILRYLMQYRYGPMDELLGIFESARGFELDTYSFEERILLLLMLAQDYRKEGEKVLEAYIGHSGNDKVIGAYLTQTAYGIFVKEYAMSPFIRDCLQKACEGRWPVDRVCRLALFQAIVKEKDPKGHNAGLKQRLLEENVKDGLVFSFYRKLPAAMLSPYQLDDKIFVECHADPDARVMLYYSLDAGIGGEEGYRTKPLTTSYEGIFTRTFTLFYGETLRYFFEIEQNGNTRRTAERVVTMNRLEGRPVSKYQQINQILSARRLGKGSDVTGKLRKFLRQEQYVNEMFPIDKE